MASKKDILRKLKILITQQYDTPEEAYAFFDKNTDSSLSKSEVRELLKAAGVSRFITSIAAGQILNKFDEDKNGRLTWKEFKNAVKELHDEENW